MSNKKQRKIFKSILSIVMVFTMVTGMIPVMGGSQLVPKASADTIDNSIINWDSLPQIAVVKTKDTTTDGKEIEFTHPGIFASKENLDLMREMIHEGYDPWFSAFEKFRDETRASKEYVNTNAERGHTYIGNADRADAGAAYAQIIMWWVTGDKDYYDKAIDIVRSYCESYDPEQFANRELGTSTDGTPNVGGYGWSADIITAGMIIQKLAFTAEILRYTQPGETYDNVWTEEDTAAFTKVLQMAYPLYDRTDKWMNQTSFTFQAMTASAVFQSDADMYALAIERATVNKEANWSFADGSIKWQARLVDKTVDMDSFNRGDNPLTLIDIDEPIIQLAEMGRDQPHAMVGIVALSGIAQTALIHGTKVNEDGEIVTDGSGTNLFNFLDNRLLKGANYYFQFNLGYDVPWYPLAKGNTSKYEECPARIGGNNETGWWPTISHAGRFRLGNAGILYYYYLYEEGYNKENPDFKYVAEAQEFTGDLWGDGDSINDAAMLLAPIEAKTGEPKGPPQKIEKPTYDMNTMGFDRIQASSYTGGRAWRAADTQKPTTEYITDEFGTRTVINGTYKDDYIWFKDVDFGETSLDTFILNSGSNSERGTLFKLILLDNVNVADWNDVTRPELDRGEILVEDYSGGTSWWNIYKTKTFKMEKELSGVHSFALLYLGSSNVYNLCANLDWMSFGNSYAYDVNYVKDAPLKNNIDITSEDGAVLKNDSIFGYDSMNMDIGNRGLTVEFKSTDTGTLSLYKGTPNGSNELVAVYPIPYTGDKQMTFNIPGIQYSTIKGRNDIYYVYEGSSDLVLFSICSVNMKEENIPAVQAEDYRFVKEGTAIRKTEDDITYIELEDGAIVFYRNINLNTKSISFRIRTEGTALLTLTSNMDNNGDLSKESIYNSSGILKMDVINTNGQWTTLSYDMSDVTNRSSNVYLMASGTTVDLDYMSFTEVNTPPIIASYAYSQPVYSSEINGASVDYVLADTEYTTIIKTFDFDNDPVTVTVKDLGPTDYTCDENGSFTFLLDQTGDITFTIIADDMKSWTIEKHDIRVFATLSDLIAEVGKYDTSFAYLPATMDVYEDILAKVNRLSSEGYTEELVESLKELAHAVTQLIPLIPTEANGTIDYIKYSDSIFFTKWAGGLSTNTQAQILSDISSLTDGSKDSYIEWRPTNAAPGQENRAYLGLDFGQGLGVKLDHFDIQTRQGFPQRTLGVVIRGSNDGVNWVVISDSAKQTEAMQTVNIKSEYKDTPFRYIKLVNPKGTNADANNFLSVAEFYIYGQVVANNIVTVNAIENVHIESDNIDSTFAALGSSDGVTEGDRIILTFDAKEPIKNVAVNINGKAATVFSEDDVHYRATYTVGKVYSEMPAENTAFIITYDIASDKDPDITYIVSAVNQTSDGSKVRIGKVFVDGEIDILKEAVAFNANGVANWGAYAGVYNSSNLMKALLDLNAVNYIDSSGASGGNLWLSVDFGEDKTVEVDYINLASSNDSGANNARWNRVKGSFISGSNDGETWIQVTEKIAEAGIQGQTTWLRADVLNEQRGNAYRYLKLENEDSFGSGYWYGNVTQLRIFGNVITKPEIVDATITPETVEFDKNTENQADVTVTIDWNSATEVTDIKFGDISLNETDYIVNGDELTIKKEFLVEQEEGSLVLTVEFDKGNIATLTIVIMDTTEEPEPEIVDAAITPETAEFDKNTEKQADMTVTINWNSATEVTDIKFGDISLNETDYIVDGTELTIKKEFLAEQEEGSLVLTVEFDKGNTATLTIVIMDTTEEPEPEVVDATITPETAEFDRNTENQADVTVTINWNSATKVTDIKFGDVSLNETDYTVNGNSITIKKEFLAEQEEGSLVLTVEFDKGNTATLAIVIMDTTEEPEPEIVDATITPETAEFDKNTEKQADVTVTINWNSATEVIDVKFGDISLNETDYIVNGNELTIKKEFLVEQEKGSLVLNVEFNKGNTATLAIVIMDTTEEPEPEIVDAIITPETAEFDKNTEKQADVTVTINWNSATEVTDIKFADISLNETDYIVDGNELTIKKEFLLEQEKGSLILTVEFDKGSTATLTIRLVDTTEDTEEPEPEIVDATITPEIAEFDKNTENQADVTVTINWNSATEVTDIKQGEDSLEAEVYTVSGSAITIKKEFLAEQKEGGLVLTVEFDKGNTSTLTIIIKDSGIDPGDPGTDPGDPGTDPGDPGTDPGDPGTDPEEPGTNPGIGFSPAPSPSTTSKEKVNSGELELSKVVNGIVNAKWTLNTSNALLYTDSLISQLKSQDTKSLYLTVEAPKDGKDDELTVRLDSRLLNTAIEESKDITVSVTDKEGKELYTWTFDGSDLANTDKVIWNVNLTLQVKETKEDSGITSLLSNKNQSGWFVDFSHNGALPSQAAVKIYVGNQSKIPYGKKVYVYHYNEKTDKLETLPYSSKYQVDEEGYITLNVLHASKYVVLEKEADSKVYTSLRDQITVTSRRKTLYESGSKNTSTYIILNLPNTLEVVSTLKDKNPNSVIGGVVVSYSTDNKKVASVNENGEITAHSKGTARITTKITLYSGKVKTVITNITVK